MVFCEQKATENKVSKAMIHPPSHTHISTKSGRHKRDREKEEVKKKHSDQWRSWSVEKGV